MEETAHFVEDEVCDLADSSLAGQRMDVTEVVLAVVEIVGNRIVTVAASIAADGSAVIAKTCFSRGRP